MSLTDQMGQYQQTTTHTLSYMGVVCARLAPFGSTAIRIGLVSWPEVVKGVPNQGVDCSVS